MIATTGRLAAPLIVALLLNGCVYTRSMRRDDRPNTARAYIYGRFQMADNGNSNAMGFVLGCQGEKYESYNIGFSRTRPLQVFEVVPGTCQIDEAIYTDGKARLVGQRAAPLAVLRNRELLPGVGYYMGDFLAVSTTTVEYPKQHLKWGLREVRSEYAKTTEEMKRAFPNLASLPTEDATKPSH